MEILAEIFKTIESFNRIIIHRHVRPDLDAVGSQVGLAKWLKTYHPEKDIYCVGENDQTLTYLATKDEIDNELFYDALIIVCVTANHERVDDERYKLGQTVIKIDHHPLDDQCGALHWVNSAVSSTSAM